MSKEKKVKIKHIKRNGYEYNQQDLLKMVEVNPNLKLNKAQTLILFPNLTSNQIKYMTSPRCRHEDIIPCERIGNKPYFIYNQVAAWNNKDRSVVAFHPKKPFLKVVEQESQKGKKGKTS